MLKGHLLSLLWPASTMVEFSIHCYQTKKRSGESLFNDLALLVTMTLWLTRNVTSHMYL
jgi:hypothetical protein